MSGSAETDMLNTARAVPPPTSKSSDTGELSDDELSVHARNLSLSNIVAGQAAVSHPPSTRPPLDRPGSHRSSNYGSISSPRSPPEKRTSRVPPPVPSSPPSKPPLRTRPAPPPPPPDYSRRPSATDSLSSSISHPRQAGEPEGEATEYEGDYDTDIASGAKFKEALKARGRDSSIDEGNITDEHQSMLGSPPKIPKTVPPPVPPSQPPKSSRGSVDLPRVPPPPPPVAESYEEEGEYDSSSHDVSHPSLRAPPPPSQPPKSGRGSVDLPRVPPPPPPVAESYDEQEEFGATAHGALQPNLPRQPPPIPRGHPESVTERHEDDEFYDAPSIQSEEPGHSPQSDHLSALPPQLPSHPSPGSGPSLTRPSLDVPRGPSGLRRSLDVTRPSLDQGYIATDIDLSESKRWWSKPNTPPPAFQNRQDLLLEIEESTQRGARVIVTRAVYALFLDYSQTVVSVRFDAKNPSDAVLDQRHEPPPLPPRQDQLERAHSEIGANISEAVEVVQHTTVGDGTPFGLIGYLLAPLKNALQPVGTRAYGALVYANLANASVQQNDEIREGDIIRFRNARFHGHRGTMHQKYNAEVGKPDHVGVVLDWDGTKKKVRAWEQGRENKKVKIESFRLGDMRSGECKIWRVMPRSWVGWEETGQ